MTLKNKERITLHLTILPNYLSMYNTMNSSSEFIMHSEWFPSNITNDKIHYSTKFICQFTQVYIYYIIFLLDICRTKVKDENKEVI